MWVVNETFSTIYVFSNDGSKLLKTLGEKNVQGADGKEAYTRAGSFDVNANGQLQTKEGQNVLGEGGPDRFGRRFNRACGGLFVGFGATLPASG